jgi:hypothetical protein
MHPLMMVALALAADGAGWQSLFDGKTLAGWKAPDMSFWSVEDGAITGTVTAEHRPPRTLFLVWQGGTVDDFELEFRFRAFGEKANSGMQLRSEVREQGLVHGYQADIAQSGPYLGGLWDEFGPRKSLAARGEKVVIADDGKRTVTRFADAAKLLAGIDLSRWHEYRVVARGARIVLHVDGQMTADLEDHERGKARASGVLAVPVITEPMKIQYKDLRLRRLGAAP